MKERRKLEELKNILRNEYYQATLKKWQCQLECRDVNYVNNHLLGPYEYSPGTDYIGLGKWQHLMDTPMWKQAHKELVEEGTLEQDPNPAWPYHYRYIPVDQEELTDFFNIDVGPYCPYPYRQLDRQMKQSQWWKDLRNKFNTGNNHLHHKSCEAYIKVIQCWQANMPFEQAYNELKNDLIVLTPEEHLKAHNRKGV